MGQYQLTEIVNKIPELATYFLDTNEGQLTEEVMDQFIICRFQVDDRRTVDKDKRCQSHQRAVVLNSEGAIARRKQWLEARVAKQGSSSSNRSTPNDQAKDGGHKRRRAPNRSKEVIEAEKESKRQRKAEREARKAANITYEQMQVDGVESDSDEEFTLQVK